MSKEIKSKEDVLNQFPSSLIKGGGYPQYNYKDVLAAMEAYHSQFTDNWISVDSGKLPETIEGEDYSENVFAICGGRLMVMAYCYIDADENSGWAWCNCNGDIYGDAYFDDDYKPTHWQPLPALPAPPAK